MPFWQAALIGASIMAVVIQGTDLVFWVKDKLTAEDWEA